ncbi:MAG: cobalamin-binding protein [Pseudohongiellaceae bacterium]
MKTGGLTTLLCTGLLFTGIPATAAVNVVDDEGTRISLESPATRIVSLAPSITEILFAAGAGELIVGVVEYSDFPAAAKSIPVVGRHDSLDMEVILSLEPDLVIAWGTGNPRASVARLRELGLTVYVAEPRELQSIPRHLERLGLLAGTGAVATSAAADFDARLALLAATYNHRKKVRVFYQVWNVPLITAGGNELINDIINLCGGENIFAELNLVAPKVSEEAVLARNPDVIIASGMDVARPEWLDNWLRWPALGAVSRGQLHFIPPELIQRHTPRALDGAEMMCEQIQQSRDSGNL